MSEQSSDMSKIEEPLLAPCGTRRFVLFPIERPEIWALYKEHVSTFWTAEEITLDQDVRDWETLSEDERRFLRYTLGFFANSDTIVNFNLLENFSREIEWPEVACFYGFQIAMENVHSEVYSLLIDRLVKDDAERAELFNAIERIPAVAAKANWALRWTDSEKNSFAQRLVAFATFEGLMFASSFASVFWMKQRAKLPGLSFSNELISRDESLHCKFACHLYTNHVVNRLTEEEAHAIVGDAVETERVFVSESLPVELIGMSSKSMIQYVQFQANRLLRALGHSDLYPGVKNPFDWMKLINLDGRTNFFEKRVGEYAKRDEVKAAAISGKLELDGEF